MERLMHAECSSDLGEAIDNELGDVDVLRAAGAAAQDKNLDTALALWRLMANRDYRQLPRVTYALLDRALHEGMEKPDPAIINVMAWVMVPTCQVCMGRCKTLVYGVENFLSDEDCKACNGSGQSDPGFTDNEKALRDWLLNLQGLATGAIKRKLSG